MDKELQKNQLIANTLNSHDALEAEYYAFDFKAKKRYLKAGKNKATFTQLHGQLWADHEAAMKAIEEAL